jgi:rhodanese-related sulfurtransferase
MQNISVQELIDRQNAGEQLNIIDVREDYEYAEFNIGALHLPLAKIQQMDIEAIEPLRTQEIIIHCRSGVRSMNACLMLEQMGFTNTKNLAGGILEYINIKGV